MTVAAKEAVADDIVAEVAMPVLELDMKLVDIAALGLVVSNIAPDCTKDVNKIDVHSKGRQVVVVALEMIPHKAVDMRDTLLGALRMT